MRSEICHSQDSGSLSGKHWNPGLSSQLGFTYHLEINTLCHGASTLEYQGHLDNDDGTEVSEVDRVAEIMQTFCLPLQLGVAVDEGAEHHWPIHPRLHMSVASNASPCFNFHYGVILHVFIIVLSVIVHRVTGQGGCACRDVRGADGPDGWKKVDVFYMFHLLLIFSFGFRWAILH